MTDRSLRLAAAIVALAGVVVAGYLTWVHFDDAALVCVAGGGCETVQESEYAEIAGIPVAALGLVAYAIVLGLVAWDAPPARLGAATIALVGLLFSMYLLGAAAVRHRRGLRLVHGERRRDRAGARCPDRLAAQVIGTCRKTFGATRSRISARVSPVHVRPWFRSPITAWAGSGSCATRSATATASCCVPHG